MKTNAIIYQPLLYQNLQSERSTLVYGHKKRSQAVLVQFLYASSFAQQELNDIALVVRTRNMQRSLQLFVEAVDLCIIFNKNLIYFLLKPVLVNEKFT